MKLRSGGDLVRGAWAFVRDRYLAIDPRAASLFRITLAALLVADALRHWAEASFIYSNDGVLSNHHHLYRPSSGDLFSFFHAFSSLREVSLLFALGLGCHLLLLVGYRARLFALLSLLFVTSRGARIPLVENGGYIVVNLACLWACFLPLGARFSVDAWRRGWRSKKETSIEDFALEARGAPDRRPVRSIAGLAVVANLGVIYLFNVLNKSGHIWREGAAVHYVLHIDRMVTGVGVFVREHAPEALLKAADYGTLAVEATLCVLILSPYGRRLTRPLAIALIVALHTTLGVFMRLGPFSWALLAWSPVLLLPIHFDRMHRFYAARSAGCELGVDVTSPFALAFARVVARLDHGRRVAIVALPETNAGPPAMLVARPAGAPRDAPWSTSAADIARLVADALPFGRWLHRVVQLATFGLFDRTIALAFARPAQISRFFGLTTRPAPDARPSAALARRMVKAGVAAREVVAGYLVVCAILQTWIENKIILKSIPPPLKEGQELRPDERWWYDKTKALLGGRVIPLKPERSPEFLQLTIAYLRIFQGWGMFAPNPIREDGVLAVDALTIDGRHLDPLTGRAPDLDLTDSRGEGLSQLRQDYGNRIRLDRNEGYRDGLRDYIVRLPERTGDPKDEIVSVDVYWVRDDCPPPGASQAVNGEAVPILSWRKPGYRPAPGQPKLPPKLKPRSAEKDEREKRVRATVTHE